MPREEKIYTSMYSRNAELYHHGILGMKWGVRNGPPYPLDSSVYDVSFLNGLVYERGLLTQKFNELNQQNIENGKEWVNYHSNSLLPIPFQSIKDDIQDINSVIDHLSKTRDVWDILVDPNLNSQEKYDKAFDRLGYSPW